MKVMCVWLFFSLFVLLPVAARDSDEPFQDPAESNPAESLRRVARLMSRLSKSDLEGEELERLQAVLQDRLTRTLLAMEEAQEKYDSQGGGSGKNKRPNKDKKPQKQSGQKRKTINHKNQSSSKKEGEDSQPTSEKQPNANKKEGEGNGQQPIQHPEEGDKAKIKPSKDRWGKLPPKERDALELNLKRDVPDGFEEDMKDFLKRVKGIK